MDDFHAKQDTLRENLRQLVRDLHKSHGWHSEEQVSREKELREEVKNLKILLNEKEWCSTSKERIDNDGFPIGIDGELEQTLNILLSFSCSSDAHQVMTMARKAIAWWDGDLDIYNRAVAEARLAHSLASAEASRTLAALRRAEAGYGQPK